MAKVSTIALFDVDGTLVVPRKVRPKALKILLSRGRLTDDHPAGHRLQIQRP